MFDIGWSEMMVVALLALIVIGPKDLPGALRKVGQWTRKARGLAREFQGHFDDLAREADLEDARKAVNQAKSFNLEKEVENVIDPDQSISGEARDLGREMRTETSAPKPAATSSPTPAASDPDPALADMPSAADYAMPVPETPAAAAPEVAEPAPEPTPVKRRRGGAAPKVDDGATA